MIPARSASATASSLEWAPTFSRMAWIWVRTVCTLSDKLSASAGVDIPWASRASTSRSRSVKSHPGVRSDMRSRRAARARVPGLKRTSPACTAAITDVKPAAEAFGGYLFVFAGP